MSEAAVESRKMSLWCVGSKWMSNFHREDLRKGITILFNKYMLSTCRCWESNVFLESLSGEINMRWYQNQHPSNPSFNPVKEGKSGGGRAPWSPRGSSNSFAMDRVQVQKENVGGREQWRFRLGNSGSPSCISVTVAAASCFFSSHWLSLLLKRAVLKAPGYLYLLCSRGQPRLKLYTLSPDSKFPTPAQLRSLTFGRVGRRGQICLECRAWQETFSREGRLLRTGWATWKVSSLGYM